MFRRGMRREERRDVVEVAAVGGVVHEAHKANEAEAQLAEAQAQQAEAAAAPLRRSQRPRHRLLLTADTARGSQADRCCGD